MNRVVWKCFNFLANIVKFHTPGKLYYSHCGKRFLGRLLLSSYTNYGGSGISDKKGLVALFRQKCIHKGERNAEKHTYIRAKGEKGL